ncbi:n-acetyltransferase ats1 [Fusarium albosuccineum]|uniref:N-acetyltransferase ats1 n=1 Tax=Fusarium albosuccineum TaxID=1237068 RepID=A0A8H4PJK1_9HYPO|nr:n-acetyltransferase ats1 [Fusarium albosuccineum]
MSDSPSIRYARIQDVPLILRFIKEAAEEQAPGATVAATEDRLSKTLHFGLPSADNLVSPTRFAWALLIHAPDGKAAGILIYLYNYSTWTAAPGVCLEELYVVPEYRRHGYARMLVEAMASAARAAGCVKMDWVCLQDNERALGFYRKLGAKSMEDWVVLKVDRDGIERLANGKEIS